jgi:hypothetical protein
MPHGSIIVVFTLLALATMAACSSSTITQPQDVVFPDSNVRFRGQVLPFLTVTCANGGCHSDITAAAGIRLTSYSSIMFDRPNLIVPSRPNESVIIQILEGVLTHPFGNLQQNITANHVRGMRQWVAEGALNN